jgi:hypothetical protein
MPSAGPRGGLPRAVDDDAAGARGMAGAQTGVDGVR